MRKTKTIRKPPQWAKSLAEAARITKISRTTLAAYKRDGCGAFKANGQVNLVELDVWTETNGKRTAKDSEEMRVERLRILRATACRLERENSERDGKVVNRDAISQTAREIMSVLFSELDRIFLTELPPALKGLDEVGIRARAEYVIEQLKDSLREKFEAIGQGDAPATAK